MNQHGSKNKAIKLVNKFLSAKAVLFNNINYTMSKPMAKICATICVDEIIKSSPNKPSETPFVLDYWNEVKHEIDSL